MKTKKIMCGLAIAGIASAFAAPSQAAILDAWQMEITGDTYTDIGRLSITAGSATILQETNAAGDIFVGAGFVETGVAYNISYILDNIVGGGDTGAPASFAPADWLEMAFSDVTGIVTSIDLSGAFDYAFTGGDFTFKDYNGTNTTLATGSVVGSTGSFGDHFGIAGANGSSVLDVVFSSIAGSPTFNLLDSSGDALDLSTIIFEAHTNNQATSAAGAVTSSCGSSGFAFCREVTGVNSNGDAFLSTVPEPATLALLGLGLVGMAASVKKKKA